MAADLVLDERDAGLLDRLASRIVELRLETAAILALETARPMSLLTSQAMVFFEPFVQALFRLPDYRRFAALIERREALEALARRIEYHADARAAGDAAARAARTRRPERP
jgi:hypothetical protein